MLRVAWFFDKLLILLQAVRILFCKRDFFELHDLLPAMLIVAGFCFAEHRLANFKPAMLCNKERIQFFDPFDSTCLSELTCLWCSCLW